MDRVGSGPEFPGPKTPQSFLEIHRIEFRHPIWSLDIKPVEEVDHMRWIALVAVVLLASPAAAQNLLLNPDFDLDPTGGGTGWVATGSGSFTWNQGVGDPAPPSIRTTQNNDESMTVCQCVQITALGTYDFSARSYTNSATGSAQNGVSLSVFTSTDCSGSPLETVSTNTVTFPNWALRERTGYVAPMGAQSGLIILSSAANGTVSDISWDSVILTGPGTVDATPKSWGMLKDLYK
jgi:hypothetical protein